MVDVDIDSRMVMANIGKLKMRSKIAIPRAALDIAYEIMRLSQQQVPHDEGTLQNSGTVEPMPNNEIVIGYHTPYAARLHEHPEYRFQKGRKGKYLEDPIETNKKILGLKFTKRLRDGLKNG